MTDALSCIVENESPTAVIRLAGCLDLHTTRLVRTTLRKCMTSQPETIVVDLDGVTVGDEVAVTVFAAAAREAAVWPGCTLLLCTADPAVTLVLDRMAVCQFVPCYESRELALAMGAQLPPPPRRYKRLWPAPISVSLAREAVRDTCLAWGLDGLVDAAQLVISELVSNGIRHAGTAMDLGMALRPQHLHLSVRDYCLTHPRRLLPDEADEGGRGLLVVEALTAAWGSNPTPDGKVVWATMRRPPAAVP